MGIKSIAAGILWAPLLSTGSVEAKPVPHSPTGRWVVDFAEHQCLASRNYGDAKNPLFLALKPSPIGDIMQLVVVKKTGWLESPSQMPVKLQVDDQPPLEFSMLALAGKSGEPQNFRINLSRKDFDPIRMAKRLSIISGSKLNDTFHLAQMTPLMKAMDACVADLQRLWNVGPAGESKLRSQAKANLIKLFSSNDYPGVSLNKREGGLVGLVLLVDEQGKVVDCTVTQTSGRAALDTQACAIVMTRAKYTPAIGPDGKPAKDADVARIRWEMP